MAIKLILLRQIFVIKLILSLLSLAQAQSVGGIISRIGDTTHLEFRGLQEWNYVSPQKNKNIIKAQIPAFDDATVVQLQSWSGPLIKSIKVDKNAPDGKYEITFTLNSDRVESFDYLTDDPSYLVIDFYEKKLEPKAISEKQIDKNYNKKKKNKKIANQIAASEYKKIDRSPASTELLAVNKQNQSSKQNEFLISDETTSIQFESGVFDGGDPNYDRFKIKEYEKKEASLIASQQNIYLRYPMLLRKLSKLDELKKNSPVYEIKPNESEENKVARLLITLFSKKRFGAFSKTKKYFEEKYPKSDYNETVKNLEAETHLALYERDGDKKDFDRYMSIYRYLVDVYPDSILTERNYLMLLYSNLERGDGAETLRDGQKFLSQYTNSNDRQWVKFAIAESYMILSRPKEAIHTYEDVIRSAEDKNLVIEAYYRIGDVYAEKMEYQKAIDAYAIAQSKFPEHKVVYPNAQYNMSESLFWLGKNSESLNSYIEFLKMFPTHRHGGFALTRIGEQLEMLGADSRRVMGAFVEGYFRYPDSPGSEVARIRMLSRGLKTMQEREKKRAIEEIDQIASKSKLPKVDEFAVLMKADGYSRRQEYNDSLDILLNYYQSHPTTANLNTFKGRILRNISDILRIELENERYIEALNFYGKYAPTWLKNTGRVDTHYYQALAYEKAGVHKEAEKIYKEILAQLEAIDGKLEDRKRLVYENAVDKNVILLRLAAAGLAERRYRDSYTHLAAINKPMDSKHEIEKAQIGAIVAEQMGEAKKAIQFLEDLAIKYEGNSESIIGPKLQLATIYLKNANLDKADENLSYIENIKNKENTISDENWAKTLELRADQQYRSGQKLAAVDTYLKLLEAYENKYPLDSLRYRAGRILFDEGDLKSAEKIWSALNDSSGDIYKKLAYEKLGQAEWSDNYKKYVERIPAAEKLK